MPLVGSPKEVGVTPSEDLTQMTEVKQLTLDNQQLTADVTVSGGGGLFLPNFQESLLISMELYLGDQICSKCITKSFVSYLVNKI